MRRMTWMSLGMRAKLLRCAAWRQNAGALWLDGARRPPHSATMNDLASALTEANAAVFTSLGLDPKHADVRRSDRPDLGEFQGNGALAVAKAVGKKPQEIAQSVAGAWSATAL